MFAPRSMSPLPVHHFAAPQNNYGQSPARYNNGIRRSNSLDWKPEAGLPPPPSEIDRYPDIVRHMQPSPLYVHQAERQAEQQSIGSPIDSLPTHAVTKHPKLKLRILLANGTFQAGEMITGVLEMTSSTSQRLRLGEIAVELEAFEELSSRDHAATQIFLYNRTLFQGEHLPPSNAVLPSAPIQGHWTARKGRTTFPFSFHLPASAPSSVNFAGNANLRYSIKGTAQTWWNEAKSLVTVRSDAFVVERWHDELDPRYLEPVEAIADTHIFMGGNGAIWLEASVTERLFVAGNLLMIRAGVKNNSKRHLSGVKVCITRRLIFPAGAGSPGQPAQRPSLEPQISEVIHSQNFKGPSYEFAPNEEVVVNLAVDLPKDLRTVRKTRLFEIHTVAVVSAQMGSFAKDLSVEIPIFVAHPNSVQHRRANRPIEPLHNLPQRARSAMSQHGQYRNQPSPMPLQAWSNVLSQSAIADTSHAFQPDNFNMAQFEAFAAQRGWSPAPPHGAPMHRSASAAPRMVDHQPLPAGAWQDRQASAILPPMPVPQQITRSQSAAPDALRAPLHVVDVARQSQLQSTEVNTIRHQTPDAEPVKAPTSNHDVPARRYSGSSIPVHTERHEQAIVQRDQQTITQLSIPNVPSPSQLLGPDGKPVGLSTIEEDSESAAGTVRSIRTLVGSVTRGDIAQFEAMARAADDHMEARKAMSAVGLVPDEVVLRAVARSQEKTLPSMPPSPKIEVTRDSSSKSARPRASDLFDRPSDGKATPSSGQGDRNDIRERNDAADQRATSISAQPARPASAQGLGLTALESRLKTSSQDRVVHLPQRARESEPVPSKTTAVMANVANRSARKEQPDQKQEANISVTPSSAEFEQRKRRKDVARLMKETEKESKDARVAQGLAEEALQPKAGATQESVDMDEMRKLTKEAVGRVNGWLSSSPSSSRTSAGGAIEEIDPALSPKTPSPSVLRVEGDADTDGSIARTSSRRPAEAGNSIKLSAELRALVDGTEGLPKPKKGTSISEHPSSRRFSTGFESAASQVKSHLNGRMPLADRSNEEVSIPKEFEKLLKPASKADRTPSSVSTSTTNDDDKPKYDVRSARGGRGGRVASVANMWTSIAEGTDGNQGKSTAPVLTLKPKAIRSGSQMKLDFGKDAEEVKEQQKKIKKSHAPPLIIDNKVKALEGKASGAPHFVNTTMPRPVFASPASPVRGAEERKQIIMTGELPPPARNLKVRDIANQSVQQDSRDGKLKNSRKITSDLIAAEARLCAGRHLVQDEQPALPMNGRGTTKPIGRDRLLDLRSLWGG